MAAKLAGQLREEILALGPGKFLGSEPELVERFSVSRPTFRQVSQLLAQEQLLTVRRGIRGGVYTCAPEMVTVQRAASNYLRAHHTTLAQVLDAAEVISTILVTRAARSTSPERRKQLLAIRAELVERLAGSDPGDVHELAGRLADLIALSADNPALRLQLAVLHSLVGDWRGNAAPLHPARGMAFIELRLKVIDALLENDGEVAAIYDRRTFELLRSWRGEAKPRQQDEQTKTETGD